MPEPLFDRIDTIILRVRNYERAVAWYAEVLGLAATYLDAEERLAVLTLTGGGSLTLWELKPGEKPPAPDLAGAYPIFGSSDAVGVRQELRVRGAQVDELQEGNGVRFFTFRDPDGNRLEVCQVLADAAADAVSS